MFLMIIGKKLL